MTSLLNILIIVAVSLVFSEEVPSMLGRHHGKGGSPGTLPTQPFNYILAYSWTPGFCKGQTYPGCAQPEPYWTDHFTIHGLWPQYNTTTGYPQDCTTEGFSQAAVDAVGESTMIQYWPNVQATVGSTSYPDFWTHEWTKHGTCTGLEQSVYYQSAINLAMSNLGTPALVTSNVGKTIPAADIRNAFGGASYVSLQCSGGNMLTGAFTCWNQQSDLPTVQVPCTGDVQGEDTCTSSDVTIVSLTSATSGHKGGH